MLTLLGLFEFRNAAQASLIFTLTHLLEGVEQQLASLLAKEHLKKDIFILNSNNYSIVTNIVYISDKFILYIYQY